MEILFLPFIFYILWGPFVVPYFIRATIKDLESRNCYSRAEIIQRTFILTTAIFLPVLVGGGGDIPMIYPWWFAVLGWLFLDIKEDFYMLTFSILFSFLVMRPSTWRFISREVE